jgi:hypothetical protein
MSQRTGNCPNCGAEIRFLWSSAIQTTCPYCRSILVRHDVNLDLVGVAADLPPTSSPVQLMSQGIYKGKAFGVIGRILYEYEFGGWNEWHLIFQDGTSGWLSDAQAEYAISFLRPGIPMPRMDDLQRGMRFQWDGVIYEVTTITRANYRGVEGELPFEYWNKDRVIFADLRSEQAHFATIDYSEDPALLFLGEVVDFEELQFKNLRSFEGWS